MRERGAGIIWSVSDTFVDCCYSYVTAAPLLEVTWKEYQVLYMRELNVSMDTLIVIKLKIIIIKWARTQCSNHECMRSDLFIFECIGSFPNIMILRQIFIDQTRNYAALVGLSGL